jgi:hypothetical protein
MPLSHPHVAPGKPFRVYQASVHCLLVPRKHGTRDVVEQAGELICLYLSVFVAPNSPLR